MAISVADSVLEARACEGTPKVACVYGKRACDEEECGVQARASTKARMLGARTGVDAQSAFTHDCSGATRDGDGYDAAEYDGCGVEYAAEVCADGGPELGFEADAALDVEPAPDFDADVELEAEPGFDEEADSQADPQPAQRVSAFELSPRELGRRGEEAACDLLRRKDYVILERNWTCPAGEADIIARDEECLVFVEVKTRIGVEHGLPCEAVTARKRSRYERIAGYFLKEYDGADARVRFDVIGILVVSDSRALIRHVVNAFGAGE